MNDTTRKMILGWLASENGNIERTVEWMARNLYKITRPDARKAILQATGK